MKIPNNFLDDEKVLLFNRLIGRADAFGMILRLLGHCDSKKTYVFGQFNKDKMAVLCRFDGDSSALLEAFVKCEICSIEGDKLLVHFDKKPSKEKLPFDSLNFKNAWEDFKIFRVQKKKPLTERSCNLIFKDMLTWGEQKSIESLKNSIRNGWQGVFEPKFTRKTYKEEVKSLHEKREEQKFIDTMDSLSKVNQQHATFHLNQLLKKLTAEKTVSTKAVYDT